MINGSETEPICHFYYSYPKTQISFHDQYFKELLIRLPDYFLPTQRDLNPNPRTTKGTAQPVKL